MEQEKTNSLKRIICIRISEEDYQNLIGFNNPQKREVSRLLRNLIRAALDMVIENNLKK
jgi:hypothetical protein